jgi:hypothetical protein
MDGVKAKQLDVRIVFTDIAIAARQEAVNSRGSMKITN